MSDYIPVNIPSLDGNERKYLNQCIDEGWISSEGPFVKEFEVKFAERMDRKFGVAVNSGTAALDFALASLNLSLGDEVIMPTFTIICCASAIIRAGAVPVFVDAEYDTWNMDVTKLEGLITKKTKAIMVVHIYGLPVDMDPVIQIAKKYNLKIIEDAAEQHGQTYKNKKIGSFGEVSIFSFYPNKHITTGEGGMILTDNEEIAEKCRSLRNLCFIPKRRFFHQELGFAARMTNLQAAIGLAQLERLTEFISIKRQIGNYYTKAFSGLKSIQLPLKEKTFAENIYWVYAMVLSDNIPFDAIHAMQLFKDNKIETRPFFWPMHLQPVLQKMDFFKKETYPIAERIALRGFYLPSGTGMKTEQLDRVIEITKNIFDSYE